MKKIDYKYMISLFFLPLSTQVTKISIIKSFRRVISTVNHSAIAQLLDAITSRQIIVELLTFICLKIHEDKRVG